MIRFLSDLEALGESADYGLTRSQFERVLLQLKEEYEIIPRSERKLLPDSIGGFPNLALTLIWIVGVISATNSLLARRFTAPRCRLASAPGRMLRSDAAPT